MADPLFRVVGAVASLAVATVVVPVGIVFVVLMAARAVCLDSANSGDVSRTGSESVFGSSADSQVAGINALSITAQMVKHESSRNRSDVKFVGNPVGLATGVLAVPLATHAPGPNPAIGLVGRHDHEPVECFTVGESSTEAPLGTELGAVRRFAEKQPTAMLAGSGTFGFSHFMPSLAAGGQERGGVTSTVRAPSIVHPFFGPVTQAYAIYSDIK